MNQTQTDEMAQRSITMLENLPNNLKKYLSEIDSLDEFETENTLENIKWILRLVESRLDRRDVPQEFIACVRETAAKLMPMDVQAENVIGFRPGEDMQRALDSYLIS